MLTTMALVYGVIVVATAAKFYFYYDVKGRFLLFAFIIPLISLFGYPIWVAKKIINDTEINRLQKLTKWIKHAFLNTINLPLSIARFGVEMQYKIMELNSKQASEAHQLHLISGKELEIKSKRAKKKTIRHIEAYSMHYSVDSFAPAFFRFFNRRHRYC